MRWPGLLLVLCAPAVRLETAFNGYRLRAPGGTGAPGFDTWLDRDSQWFVNQAKRRHDRSDWPPDTLRVLGGFEITPCCS
jgi:hypothetical protein